MLTRRSFVKVLGLTTAALVVPQPPALVVPDEETMRRFWSLDRTMVAPAPVLLGLSEMSASTDSGPLLLTLRGHGFRTCTVGLLNGERRALEVISDTEARLIIPARLMAQPGPIDIAVAIR